MGRSIGLVIILIFIFIAVGNLFGEKDPYAITSDTTEIYPTLIIISIWIVFFIIAWFNELIGLIGTIFWPLIWGIVIYNTSGTNKFIAATLIPTPLLLTGVLFLVAYVINKRNK